MRLYPRMGQKIVSDPEYGYWGRDAEDKTHRPDVEDGFDFPDELSDRLVRFHHRGHPLWENEEQRSKRLVGEDTARRRDPQTLYSAVEDIANITRQLAGIQLGNAQNPDVDALRTQVAELQAQLAAKETQKPENPAGTGEDEDDAPGEPEAKTAGKRNRSAPKAS